MDVWQAELQASNTIDLDAEASQAASSAASSSSWLQPEVTSHNWKEGERIGEAKQPGPNGHNLSGNRAPRVSRTHAQASTGGPGPRGAPQAPNIPILMNNRPIGTPGNDGQPGAKDLRPRGPAGSPPESQHRARSRTPGVRADHQRGVGRHAVNPAIPNLMEIISNIEEQLRAVRAQVGHLTAKPAPQAPKPPNPPTLRDDNPRGVIAPKRRARNNRKNPQQRRHR
jgi:hypothetical protein